MKPASTCAEWRLEHDAGALGGSARGRPPPVRHGAQTDGAAGRFAILLQSVVRSLAGRSAERPRENTGQIDAPRKNRSTGRRGFFRAGMIRERDADAPIAALRAAGRDSNATPGHRFDQQVREDAPPPRAESRAIASSLRRDHRAAEDQVPHVGAAITGRRDSTEQNLSDVRRRRRPLQSAGSPCPPRPRFQPGRPHDRFEITSRSDLACAAMRVFARDCCMCGSRGRRGHVSDASGTHRGCPVAPHAVRRPDGITRRWCRSRRRGDASHAASRAARDVSSEPS